MIIRTIRLELSHAVTSISVWLNS